MRVCQQLRRHLWESLRDWLSVPPFTRAFLKSPISRDLSAIAELLVNFGFGSIWLLAISGFCWQYSHAVNADICKWRVPQLAGARQCLSSQSPKAHVVYVSQARRRCRSNVVNIAEAKYTTTDTASVWCTDARKHKKKVGTRIDVNPF